MRNSTQEIQYVNLKKTLTENERETIHQLWLADFTCEEIAEEFRMTLPEIKSYLLGYSRSVMLKQVRKHLSALNKEIKQRSKDVSEAGHKRPSIKDYLAADSIEDVEAIECEEVA